MATLPKVLINYADYQIGGGCCTSAQNSRYELSSGTSHRSDADNGAHCVAQAQQSLETRDAFLRRRRVRATLPKRYAVAGVNGVLRSLINFKVRYKAKSPNWIALLTA
jgi:hypothetical protein